jgi:hypothetical protein
MKLSEYKTETMLARASEDLARVRLADAQRELVRAQEDLDRAIGVRIQADFSYERALNGDLPLNDAGRNAWINGNYLQDHPEQLEELRPRFAEGWEDLWQG